MHQHLQHTVTKDSHDKNDHTYANFLQQKAPYTPKMEQFVDVQKNIIASTPKTKIDLRQSLSPIMNQGFLNSCSACAISASVELLMKKANKKFINASTPYTPSAMFIYYNERVKAGKTDQNAPVQIRDGFKSLTHNGVCEEPLWPYPKMSIPEDLNNRAAQGDTEAIAELQAMMNTTVSTVIKATPSKKAIDQALLYRTHRYLSVTIKNGLDELKQCLSNMLPVVFGMMLPQDFFTTTKQTGILSTPSQTAPRLGGHAIVAVGYDDDKNHFIIRNSFGEEFGDNGYFYMPYDFVTGTYISEGEEKENAFSFWTLLGV